MLNVSRGFIVNFEHVLTLNFVTSFSNVSIVDFEQVKVTHEVIHYVRCAQIYKIIFNALQASVLCHSNPFQDFTVFAAEY